MRLASLLITSACAVVTVGCLHAQQADRVYFEAESDEFADAVAEYQAIWDEDGDRIIETMERRTGLRVESRPIQVIVHEGVSFSGYKKIPMRMRASYPLDTKRATFVHELSHRLLADITTKDFEDHPYIFLFLYDVWVELWGREFADAQVAVESRRRGIYDYEGAWNTALEMSAEEREKHWREFLEER